MNLITFTDNQEFISKSAKLIADSCPAESTGKPGYVAFSGGNTPKDVYVHFAKRFFPFIQVRLRGFVVDERSVPETAPESNWGMLQKTILHGGTFHATDSFEEFHYFNTNIPIENAIIDYEKKLQTMEEQGFTFDLVILGMGTDGHIASLFPGSPAVHEELKFTAHTTTQEHEVKDRMTMTFPAILSAKKILLLLSGESKKEILEKLLNSDATIEELPAKKLLEHENLVIHYLET